MHQRETHLLHHQIVLIHPYQIHSMATILGRTNPRTPMKETLAHGSSQVGQEQQALFLSRLEQ